jgi:hypothetical protein
LWFIHGTRSYICMYINADADGVMLYLRHDFITQFLKRNINYIYSLRVSPPPPPAKKFWMRTCLTFPQLCCWKFTPSDMCLCAFLCAVPDATEVSYGLYFGRSASPGRIIAWSLKMKTLLSTKRRELIIHRHSVTSETTWMLNIKVTFT